MKTSALLAPRAFKKPMKGETKWCSHCEMTVHAHRLVGCSQCGGKFRACILGINKNGFSECEGHR